MELMFCTLSSSHRSPTISPLPPVALQSRKPVAQEQQANSWNTSRDVMTIQLRIKWIYSLPLRFIQSFPHPNCIEQHDGIRRRSLYVWLPRPSHSYSLPSPYSDPPKLHTLTLRETFSATLQHCNTPTP